MSEENRELARLRNLVDCYYDTKEKVRLKREGVLPKVGVAEFDKPHPPKFTEIFEFLVQKKLLLSQLELLHCSYELENDPKWSINWLNSILKSIESLRRAVVTTSSAGFSICLADVCDTFVLTNGFVMSEMMERESDLSKVSESVEIYWYITRGVVILLLCNTMLLGQCYGSQQHLVSNAENWCDLHVGPFEGHFDVKDFIHLLWGRVWQEVGHRLVPRLIGMAYEPMKEDTIQRIRRLMKEFPDTSPVHYCMKHVVDSINSRDEIFKFYTESARRSLELSDKSSPLAVRDNTSGTIISLQKRLMFFKEKRHTIPFQDLSKYAAQGTVEMESRATSDRTVVEDTQNCNRDMYLENTVATESNAMLMSYQLIPAVHSAVWSVHRWMIHRLQQSLSKNDLSDITQLVFEVSMSFREKWREVVCGCGAAAAPLLRLSKESPQYWIARWNRQAYSRLHEGNIQSEYVTDCLCGAFLTQWRGKCRQLLGVVFPSSEMWKKREKAKDLKRLSSSPQDKQLINVLNAPTTYSCSPYLTPIKEQLVSPLLCACDPLSSSMQQVCLYLTFTTLVLELRSVIMKRNKSLSPSSHMSKQLQLDCQYLVSFFTDKNNSLQPRTREVVSLMPILRVMEQSLTQEENGVSEENEPMVKEVHQRIHGMSPFKILLNELGWLNLS